MCAIALFSRSQNFFLLQMKQKKQSIWFSWFRCVLGGGDYIAFHLKCNNEWSCLYHSASLNCTQITNTLQKFYTLMGLKRTILCVCATAEQLHSHIAPASYAHPTSNVYNLHNTCFYLLFHAFFFALSLIL